MWKWKHWLTKYGNALEVQEGCEETMRTQQSCLAEDCRYENDGGGERGQGMSSTNLDEGMAAGAVRRSNLERGHGIATSFENVECSPSCTNPVKIEIDNPEMVPCHNDKRYPWTTETPLELTKVKAEIEIDDSESTNQEGMSHRFNVAPGFEADKRICCGGHDEEEEICEDCPVRVKQEMDQDLCPVVKDTSTMRDDTSLDDLPGLCDESPSKKEKVSCKKTRATSFKTSKDNPGQHTKGKRAINSFVCQVCWKTFTSHLRMMSHCVSEHDMCKVYKCTFCQKEFIEASEYRTHRSMHLEYDYMMTHSTCPVCCIEFLKEEHLDRHLVCHTSAVTVSHRSGHGNDEGKSGLLGESGNSVNCSKKYPVSVNTSHMCPVCNSLYETSEDLLQHLKSHKKPFQCAKCDKAYFCQDMMANHMSKHFLEKPVKCDKCQTLFDTVEKFKDHWKKHLKLFKCTYCDKAYGANYRLQRHLITHTPEANRHQCTICGKCYASKGSLEIHLRIHSGEKPYKCTQCDKAFSQRHVLKSHLRMHNEENPYVCTICDRAYRYKISLKNHMNIHSLQEQRDNTLQMKEADKENIDNTLENRSVSEISLTIDSGGVVEKETKEDVVNEPGSHFCPQCGKGCKSAAGLKRHIVSHGRMKKIHKCHVCGKVSTTKGNLGVHMRIHTGDRPYKCCVCDKSYTQSHLLKYHMMSH